jgi:hypothetical protein
MKELNNLPDNLHSIIQITLLAVGDVAARRIYKVITQAIDNEKYAYYITFNPLAETLGNLFMWSNSIYGSLYWKEVASKISQYKKEL